MAIEGAVENAYGRVYRFVKPGSSDPGTWRLAVPEAGISGGSNGGTAQDIDGVDPIQAVTVIGNPTTTTISLDMTNLAPRV